MNILPAWMDTYMSGVHKGQEEVTGTLEMEV